MGRHHSNFGRRRWRRLGPRIHQREETPGMTPNDFMEEDIDASEAADMEATEWQDLEPTED